MVSADDILSTSDIISVDCRPVRDVGNAVGISLDKEALRELGIVTEDDKVNSVDGRVVITDGGQITIDVDLEQLPEQ